jgi:hypothetical protein
LLKASVPRKVKMVVEWSSIFRSLRDIIGKFD